MRKLLGLIIFLMLPLLAQANWNDAWTARNKVLIKSTEVTAPVMQAVIPVRLHTGNFSFADAKPDGSDLRFIAADDKTELKFHIEKYDATNELALVWVQVPKVDPADKSAYVWLYYGNPAATAVEDNHATWDSTYAATFNFAEKSLLQDASANGLVASGAISVQKAALLGEAAVFNGSAISIGASPVLKLFSPSGFTYSAWIKPASLPQQATLYQQGSVALKIEGQKLVLAAGSNITSDTDLKPAAWQHVSVTISGAKVVLYIDGKSAGTGNIALPDIQQEVVIGNGYTGEMDQLELANATRSDDWMKLAVSGQGADGQLVTVEEEGAEGEEEGEISYFGILFDSLTTDAWVVIIILSIMFMISAGVMVGKYMLIDKTAKGNLKFLDSFRNANQNLLELDKEDSFGGSSVFRLYVAGIREIRKRYGANNELALSGASMDAIKASIDADMVRETQKLNEHMVLLTIAISGGPFLGLLGTVVGVMITFAAIAAAGDVNVNAIAPGIAAALLATVAGLGVAIPALFGYNYLASRIKNISTDMQIFVDEYITRVAELYGK